MKVFNSIVRFLVGVLGVPMQGAQVLSVRGRKSGVMRELVVNPLPFEGGLFLLSPRVTASWVGNIRAAGECTLHRGRTRHKYRVQEVTDPDLKLRVMRAYLARWGWQVKSFMGVDGKSGDDELRAILSKHPVFSLTQA